MTTRRTLNTASNMPAIIFASTLLVALFVALPGAPARAEPVKVIDGRTLLLGGALIRLYGIDAPDLKQTCAWPTKTIDCGVMARAALLDLVTGAVVTCKTADDAAADDDNDDGNAAAPVKVATCYADGFDIGRNMVYTGWALARRTHSQRYIGIEDNAKAAKRGLWRGKFQTPWAWRKARDGTHLEKRHHIGKLGIDWAGGHRNNHTQGVR